MTLKAFINKRLLAIYVVVFIAVLLRVYKTGQLFSFDFDQQAPAIAAYDFFKYHKLTLVGQEISFQGLFLGPLYNWSQFIPYRLCNLLPDCVPYFLTVVSVVTVIFFFLTARKIVGAKAALNASAIWSISFVSIVQDLGPSSNSYLFLSSTILLLSLFKYFGGAQNYLILASFIAGLTVVNFNPVFILTGLIIPVTILIHKRFNIKILFLSGVAFGINFIPLAIFNIRHQNLIFDSLKSFSQQNTGSNNLLLGTYNLFVNILMPFYSNFIFKMANFWSIAFTLFLIFFGLYRLNKKNNRFLIIFPIWIAITFLGLIFYKGHIPDYYFWQTLLPFILLVAIALEKNIVLFLITTILFLYTNISALVNYHSPINYQLKKEAIDFILKDTKRESFNVYYDFPPGLNTGYSYLFKAHGREPIEGGRNLYILTFADPKLFSIEKYKSAFSNKTVIVKTAGFIQVISIK